MEADPERAAELDGDMNSIPRLRRITMKSTGQVIEVLRNPVRTNKIDIKNRLLSVLDAALDDKCTPGGYAVVVWDHSGASAAFCSDINGPVPKALIPDYVRNRLLLAIAEQWAKGNG